MTSDELKDALSYFYGSEDIYPLGFPFQGYWLTDGAKYLADHGGEHGAYWLMQAIASYRHDPKVREVWFQVWRLKVDLETHKATLTCDDGNGNVLATQEIAYTDFQLAEVKLYCSFDGERWIILLPGEY